MIEQVIATVAKEVARRAADVAIEVSQKEVRELPDKIGELTEVEELPEKIDLISDQVLQDAADAREKPQNKLSMDNDQHHSDAPDHSDERTEGNECNSSESSEENNTEETDDAEKKQMQPPVDVQFTCKEKYDCEEYKRQVKNQEAGMNKIALYDYQKNREKYKENGRDTDVGGPAQEKARQEARADKVAEYRKEGMSREEAEKKADEWMDTQAALHDPDQIAGGDAANVTGMGDKEINSSIGSQWQYRIDAVDAAVQKYIEENGLSEEDMKNVFLNVNLEVVPE